jgi:ATP-dependent helicase/nuclease subunit A
MLAHPRLGLGAKMRDGVCESPTPSYRAVQAVMDSETRAEELRLLYVAMTRAEKRLILSAGTFIRDEPVQKLSRGDLILNTSVSSWLFKVRSADWKVVMPEAPSPVRAELSRPHYHAQGGPEPAPVAPKWVYPHPEAVDTPSKMTATGLKDRYPGQQAREERLSAWGGELRTKTDASERGTATHLFMQFADFEKCTSLNGVASEAARLRAEEKLTAGQSEAVDLKAVAAYFQTGRGKVLPAAKGLRREQKFSVLIADGDLPGLALPKGEKILLQGVIDCFYETPEGMVLLDFKTDRVKPGEEEARAEHYRPQMEAYAFALAAITEKPVAERVLVFLSTGREVVLSAKSSAQSNPPG